MKSSLKLPTGQIAIYDDANNNSQADSGELIATYEYDAQKRRIANDSLTPI